LDPALNVDQLLFWLFSHVPQFQAAFMTKLLIQYLGVALCRQPQYVHHDYMREYPITRFVRLAGHGR
jgi:hypothetical protein